MLKSFVLLLILSSLVSSWKTLYSEVDELAGSCFPQDSCMLHRREEDDHLWNNYTCECGMHCVQFGTCCADSPYTDTPLHVKSQGETCQKLAGMNNAVVVVSKCSDRWRYGYHIQNKCHRAKMEMDPVGMIPVTSLVTRVTYKNYFCALCNCDSRDVLFWNIALQPINKETAADILNSTEEYMARNIVYDDNQQSWGIMDNGLFYQVKLQTQLPVSLQKFVKKCYLNTISQCDYSYGQSYDSLRKCLSYYAPIKLRIDSRFVKYRNIHCALCNGVNITEIDVSICKLDVESKTSKPPFSFALLLDINTSDGDLVGLVSRCDGNETYDPFFKKCRSLVCALPGYVVKNGVCVQS